MFVKDMKTILYEELDRHFIAPQKPLFNYSKFPRKLKKKLKKVKYCDSLNQAMWNTMEENYRRFIIKQICAER